jgi:hypothetical protein
VANQTFEDIRIEQKDWPKLKTSYVFGQLPVLNISDNSRNDTIAQSSAIGNGLNIFDLDVC